MAKNTAEIQVEKMKTQYQDLSRFQVPADFRGKPAWQVQLWWLVQSTFFQLSPQFMYNWRNWLLRLFGAKIGKDVKIRSSARITYPWKLSVGDYSWVGDECDLYTLGKIRIGKNVAIAHRVYICTGTHDYQKVNFEILSNDVTIEDEVWIPNDVFIAPGVTIGRGAVIGARSTVLEDMPAGMICYGYPARPVKPREMKV
jgi:putative colanic acid biosynthesis acetyltransferase WcaF